MRQIVLSVITIIYVVYSLFYIFDSTPKALVASGQPIWHNNKVYSCKEGMVVLK